MKATFCYQTVTPESAEHGDFADHGFIMPGLWKFPCDDNLTDAKNGEFDLTDLREIINFAHDLGINECEGADWLYSVDPDTNYSTGEETTYSLHIDNVTPSTYERIINLLRY